MAVVRRIVKCLFKCLLEAIRLKMWPHAAAENVAYS